MIFGCVGCLLSIVVLVVDGRKLRAEHRGKAPHAPLGPPMVLANNYGGRI